MEKKWDTVIPVDLKKTLCKWDIYICPAGHEGVKQECTPRLQVSLQPRAYLFVFIFSYHYA
jgi:hypothetical protein